MRKSRLIFEWAEDLVIAVAVVTLFFTFITRVVSVDGASMNPNYQNGDRVLVTAHSFRVEPGDVVIVTKADAVPMIKRVVAVAGQTVDFDNAQGAVLVDGVPFDDSAYGIPTGITKISWSNYQALNFPVVVPKDSVFVLGDNRALSKDSRYAEVGMIHNSSILGTAFLKIFPFDRFGVPLSLGWNGEGRARHRENGEGYTDRRENGGIFRNRMAFSFCV